MIPRFPPPLSPAAKGLALIQSETETGRVPRLSDDGEGAYLPRAAVGNAVDDETVSSSAAGGGAVVAARGSTVVVAATSSTVTSTVRGSVSSSESAAAAVVEAAENTQGSEGGRVSELTGE